jgi:hypothetical protein
MNEIRIACVGDVMCGDSFHALGQGVDASLARLGEDFMPADVTDYLQQHSFVLCNVECILSDIGRNDLSLRRTQLRGRPQYAAYLRKWGFSVAAVANNHIFEHGREAAIDTVNRLRHAGIDVIGAGAGAAFEPGVGVVEKTSDECSVAFIGGCWRDEKHAYSGGADAEDVVAAVSRCASDGLVPIVSLHWGNEFVDRPSLWQRDYARRLIDAGAAAIVGHHPHVAQGVQELGGRIVAFSLGNFVFDSFVADTRWSVILSMTIAGGVVKKWETRVIERDQDHRPRFASGSREQELRAEFERRCRLLDEPISEGYEQRYAADVCRGRKETSRQLRRQLIRRAMRFRPVYWPQILLRPIQRRIGLW